MNRIGNHDVETGMPSSWQYPSQDKQEEMKMETTKSHTKMTFSEYFLFFTDTTTLHGLKHIGYRKQHTLLRLFWLLALILMFCAYMVCLSTSVSNYFKYPVATLVSVRNQRPLTFPAITICNLNSYRKSKVNGPYERHMIQSKYSAYNQTAYPDYFQDDIFNHFKNLDIYEWAKDAAHNLSDQIINCKWHWRDVSCDEYFKLYVTELGFCYTFNSEEYIKENGGKVLDVSRTGTTEGLYVRLNVQQYEYFYGPLESAGFKVLLHDPFRYPLMKQHGFMIGPGQESYVAMKMIRIRDLPSPYGQCLNDSDPSFHNWLRFHDRYSHAACVAECRTNYTIKQCGCRHYLSKADGIKICDVIEMVECSHVADYNFTIDYEIERACNCVDPCEDINFRPSLSSSLFPSDFVASKIGASYKVSKQYIRDNYCSIYFYYEDLSYDFIEQKPNYPLSQMLGDIGGQLGLCLGASALTLLEFLECFGYIFRKLLKNKNS